MSSKSDPSVDQIIIDISADDHDIPECKAFLCSAAGDVKITNLKGNDRVLPLVAGYNPIGATLVFKVGTTNAGTIVALY